MEDCDSMPTKNTKTSKSRGLGKGIGNLFQEEDTNDQKVVCLLYTSDAADE